ncbi:MAG: LEPR-XLL domain-containing protein [Pseudomonadales bacterium]|nr:LEPR-XLL domain-containing protein [Pseudomonadales bacterium]
MAFPFSKPRGIEPQLDKGLQAYKRKPLQAASRRVRLEAIEPRILLSADFGVGAAAATADGVDLLGEKVTDFLDSESLLEQRIPFLLKDGENQAPSIDDLLGLSVDANGNAFIDANDEMILDGWDDNSDGFVSAAELVDNLLFQPMADILNSWSGETDAFIAEIVDDLDTTLMDLGGNYIVDFNVINAQTINLTDDIDSEISLQVGFELTVSRTLPIDLGLEADDLKLHAFTGLASDPTSPEVGVDATLSFGFEFGVFTSGKSDASLTADDFYIRSADDLLVSVTAVDPDMDFNLNIGFLGARVVDGALDLQADIVSQLIDPDSPDALGFEGGHYDDLSPQYGVENTSGVVTANLDIPAFDLLQDTGFLLRIGNLGISTEVNVDDDDSNLSNADLILDIEAALAAASLDDLIEVGLSGDKVQFSVAATDVTPLGFDAESLAMDGLLLATGAPSTFEPGSTVSFLLSIGGALPSLVSVRFADAARKDIGFDPNQTATLMPLVAQSAAEPSGSLSEGGDVSADFTLTITQSGGAMTAVAIAVTDSDVAPDPNTSVADLVADLNVALTTAGVGALVSASETGGVISLSPLDASISALEISASDTVTNTDLGFGNQAVYLAMTAASSIGDVTFSDGLDNTNDDAHFVVTVNGADTDILVAADNGRTTQAELAAAIDTALGNAGLAITATESAGAIVLTADNAGVNEFSVVAENQDINDLIDDVDRALAAANVAGVAVSDNGGRLQFLAADSLEITGTLTFDAGVLGPELDSSDAVPDASFTADTGEDSNITFVLPVEVLPGIHDPSKGADYVPANYYDPQNLAIVANFDPFGTLSDLDLASNRFDLDFTVNPDSPPADPGNIPVPNPVPVETLELINFDEVLQFNQIEPGSFIGMLSGLGRALDSIMQSGEFSLYGIPFTEAVLTDMVSFEALIEDALIYDPGPNGIFDEDPGATDDANRLLERRLLPDLPGDPKYGAFPAYDTAQELGVALSDLLSLPLFSDVAFEAAGGINPTYDVLSNELTYDVDLISTDTVSIGIAEDFDERFAFNVDLSPFSEFAIKSVGVDGVVEEDLLVSFEARTVFSTTFGFNLSQSPLSTEERFFVENAEFGGAFEAEINSGGVEGSALLGIVGVDVLVDGTLGAQFSSQLKADFGAPGSQVTLSEIKADIHQNYLGNQADGIQVATDPVVQKLSSLNFDGQNALANLSAGSRVVSASGGTAYIFSVEDNGDDGTLTLFDVNGTFADDDLFIDVRNIGDALPVPGGFVNGVVSSVDQFGELTMDVTVQSGFDQHGFGQVLEDALDGLNGVVNLHLTDFGDPNVATDPAVDSTLLLTDLTAITAGGFSLADMSIFSYVDLISALESLADLISELEAAYPILSEIIPIVNRSVSDLLGLQEGVDLAIASARLVLEEQATLLEPGQVDIPTLNLQGMAAALRGAFGLADNSTGLIIDLLDDGDGLYLTLDFDIEETISTTLGLDIELGDNLPNLTSGRILRVDGELGWGFKIGIDLATPGDVQLFNPDGGFDGELSILGEGAEGIGMVFLAQVGEMPVQVMDALVDINLDFDLGGLDFGGDKKSLTNVNFSDFVSNIDDQTYDVSIPLFDVAGGLTGFLGEIAGSGTALIDDAVADAFSLLDPAALTDLEDLVDEFVNNVVEFDPLDNILLLTDTADFFFEAIQDVIDTVTSIDIPIVGDNLADGARFIEDFRAQFVEKFRRLVENSTELNADDVTTFLTDFFSGIGLDVVASKVLDTPDEVRWTLSLGETYTVPFDLGFDLGVPLLAMDLDIPIDVELIWSLDIGLGVNEADGAFILLNQGGGDELNIDLVVGMPENDLFRGELGFLEVSVDNNGSGVEFGFDVDLSNTAGGDVLAINDLGNLAVATMIAGGPTGDHLLDLTLEIGVNGLDGVFPKISTDFVMDWSMDPGALVDNVVAAGLELIDYRNVNLDLTSFLNGFLGDILNEIGEFTQPLNEIIDFLSADIPIISQLFGPTSILDIAAIFGDINIDYIDWIEGVFDVIDVINDLTAGPGDQLSLSIGELEIYDPLDLDLDGLSSAAGLVSELFNIDADLGQVIDDALGGFNNLLATAGDAIGSFDDAINALSPDPGPDTETFNAVTSLNIGDPGALFAFPFLDNPSSILGLLVGQDVTLVQVDIPPLGVGFDYDQFVTIFGPLGVSIGAGFFVGFDLSFGFDSYGLNRYARSDFTNPGLIFDGFFFGDREAGSDNDVTTGVDIPEIFLEFTLTGTAELNLGVARGGVGGGITARIFWDWHDPNNDGAVHISEIINNIEHAERVGDDAVLAPFDFGGDLSARFFAFLIIDLGIVELEYFFDIFGPEVLLDFEIGFDRSPILATDLDNGTLQLNMGPNAIDRLNGDTSDGNENFTVTYDDSTGDILISSAVLGVTSNQRYTGNYNHIVGLGGQGNDTIEFIGFDESNITFNLQGGVGDDKIMFAENAGINPATGAGAIILGGRGNDILIGSHLNDYIEGGQGNDHIEGGRGYDTLFGDSGNLQILDSSSQSIGARVSALDGDDVVYGGSMNNASLADDDVDDIIFGGGGMDELHGDAGRDIILGDGGRFNFTLTNGHIDMSGFDIADFVPNAPLDDNPATSTDEKIQNILLELTGWFSGTDLGDGANDTIFGGADSDIIFGGAANDTIESGGGNDYAVGGRGFDEISGNDGDDNLFGNGQDDIINGNAGRDVMSGSFGDDVMHGNAGDDYMTGGRGRDIMYGDADNDEVVGQGEPDILFGGTGNDLVVGGVGADIMMGDDGLVVKFGVNGDPDLVIGNGNVGLLAAYAGAADDVSGSLDLIITDPVAGDGNDILSGGEAGDLILGGGGDDLAGGDVDPRSTIANPPDEETPVGRDFIIGDGGVMQFFERRLQLVASVIDTDPTTFRDTLFGDNGRDVIIGGQGADGNDNGSDPTKNVMGNDFMLAGGHGPGRGATDDGVNDDDIIIGDNGELVYVAPGLANFGRLSHIQTTDVSNATGGADTVFGELGDDIILGGVNGGVNGSVDVLSGSLGDDVILGDNGIIHYNYEWESDADVTDNVFTPSDGDVSTLDLIRSFADGLGGIDIISGDAGIDTLLGGEAGDIIYGDNNTASAGADDGGDIILGDNGDLFFATLTGQVLVQGDAVDYITTTDTSDGTGGADTISGNTGTDIILGGVNDGGVDVLYGDAANQGIHDSDDLILGDNGILLFNYDWQSDVDVSDDDYSPGDGDRLTLDLIRSFIDGLGGVDTISGDVGGDLIIGGTNGDTIHGDNATANAGGLDGDEIILGDNGDVFFNGAAIVDARVVLSSSVQVISTRDQFENTGGADLVEGNAGDDIILGGVNFNALGIDRLYGDARDPAHTFDGDDIILGDNGLISFAEGDADLATLDLIQTTARDDSGITILGGIDQIFGNAGSDTLLGGSAGDTMIGDNDELVDESGVADLFGDGADADILIGDQGRVLRVNDIPTVIESTDLTETEGGADHIQGNDGADVIIGGVDSDELHGEAFLAGGLAVGDLVTAAGDDVMLGDEGRLRFNVTSGETLVTLTGAGVPVEAVGDDDPLTLDLIETFSTGVLGAGDEIYGNGGSDVAMGGSGDDLIYGDFYKGSLVSATNPGDDQLFGDGGEKTFQAGAAVVLRSIEPGQGGSDIIHGNDHDDVIVGGVSGDLLYGEADETNLGLIAGRAGEDIILGDNGRLDWILADDTILDRQDVEDHLTGTTVTLDSAPTTLDRITSTHPTIGGADVIYGNGNSHVDLGDILVGGTAGDTIRGDAREDFTGDDGIDGKDLAFGDHAKVYPSLAEADAFFVNNYFFSIDTQSADLGAGDVIWGNANNDILIGGQADDVMFGGTGDDDMIGGHNVAHGSDDLDAMPLDDILAIGPVDLADLNPADLNEINDVMDGGADDDVMAGDNAIIIRQPNDVIADSLLSPRFKMTDGDGELHRLISERLGGLADVDIGFEANVTTALQPHQDMTLVRTVTLLDHSETIEDAAIASPLMPRPFGNDIMVGGSEDDEIWGQLGDDVIQGDGEITVTTPVIVAYDPYNPAQGADQSFDVRDFTIRVDLSTSSDATLSFSVAEALGDGDDYIEGNGGNDRIYGNLGQDDLIGGSSTLFGLSDADAGFHSEASGNILRPDGADLIYGGAGNADLLVRNAVVDGFNTLVPEAERHATDADTILGDNGDIFRIVTDVDPADEIVEIGYARFAYDYDAITRDGFVDDGFGTADDALSIRARAVSFSDYGYTYIDHDLDPSTRDVLNFLPTARGEGDLIYGESGDDVVHGMTGADTIFGNSEHDNLHGEIGSDMLLGGTGIDGLMGDDGLILTSRNDLQAEPMNGVAALNAEQVFLKKNDEVDTEALNAIITTPGNIQVAIINIENELTKGVELFAFRTDDIDGDLGTTPTNEFAEAMRWNDIIFGGLQNDFIHGGAGDDAISGAEALPVYYSGAGYNNGNPDQAFFEVNAFLQNMQGSPVNGTPDLADNPFWFSFAPYNPGEILRFEGKAISDEHGQGLRTRDEFVWYDEFNPRRKVMFDFDAAPDDVTLLTTVTGVSNPIDFILNFDVEEGPLGPMFDGENLMASDGADRIFGDLGNDWLVGGTGRDHMYGGRGDDLLNIDDNHDSGPGGRVGPHDPAPDPIDNSQSDEFQAYADIVYSGAGRDIMILNTGADRAIDWVGEYNSYIVPFSPFGAFHISRTLQPQVPEFLFALSASDGVDDRASVDLGIINNTVDAQLFVDQKNIDVRVDDPDPIRNYEPYGELGMVRQTDFDWQEQTGAPNDPQPGNLQGKREIMRRELFSDAELALFAADVGIFDVENGMMKATPEVQGEETVSLFHLDQFQPSYMEILVTINAEKDKAGTKSNAYVIFDYQGPDEFKFAGVDVGTDKLQIGHRDASGWIVDSQTQLQLKHEWDYDLTVALFNSVATVYVDQNQNLSLDFGEALNDGGMLGVGTVNAVATFDDFQVQQLPPIWTFDIEQSFNGSHNLTEQDGIWAFDGGALVGSVDGSNPGIATQYMDLAAYSRLELTTNLNTSGQAGLVFDYYNADDFKYVTLDAATDRVIIGHFTSHGWRIDTTADFNLNGNNDYELTAVMFGTTVTVLVDGQPVLSHIFNGLLNDGDYGLLVTDGSATFDDLRVRGDDPAYGQALMAATVAEVSDEVLLTSEQAFNLLEAAAANLGLSADETSDIEIRIADLPGLMLGQLQGNILTLDINAAGHGWFIDPTPTVGEEFDAAGLAIDDEAISSIDLLTVLTHELGHLESSSHSDEGLMAGSLDVGTRLLPELDTTEIGTMIDAQSAVISSRSANAGVDRAAIAFEDKGETWLAYGDESALVRQGLIPRDEPGDDQWLDLSAAEKLITKQRQIAW